MRYTKIILLVGIISITLAGCTTPAFPAQLPVKTKLVIKNAEGYKFTDQMAIKAILGEARGEGFMGMYAIACAIRNRGSLKGVFGLVATMEPIDTKLSDLATKAWFNSATGPDVTFGAQFWEGTKFKKPYWSKNMEKTATIGHNDFYREA